MRCESLKSLATKILKGDCREAGAISRRRIKRPGKLHETARFEVALRLGSDRVLRHRRSQRACCTVLPPAINLERLTNGKVPCADGVFTHAPIDCGQDIEAVMGDLRALTAAIIGRSYSRHFGR